MVPGRPRTRAAQQLDIRQPVHVVPSPCPLVAPAISVSPRNQRQAPIFQFDTLCVVAAAAAGQVESLAFEAVPLREIDSVAKASGTSAPYVLGRKYSKHVIGVLHGADFTDVLISCAVTFLRLWLLAVEGLHCAELVLPTHDNASSRQTTVHRAFSEL